jgi:hypothetical protein
MTAGIAQISSFRQIPWDRFFADSALEATGFEPSVPLANQHPNCQVGLARYGRTGTG